MHNILDIIHFIYNLCIKQNINETIKVQFMNLYKFN